MLNSKFNESMANSEKLSRCSRHDFGTLLGFQRRLTCKRCGGIMETSKAISYAKGYSAAGGKITDIIRGLK